MHGDSEAIEVRDLRVVRGGRVALDNLSCSVPAGQITGLLGPSGCGKTTLMRSIVGVQIVAGGQVEVLGIAAGAKELRSRVGYVTQAPAIYRDLTARENLRYFARVLGLDADRVEATIATVHLGDDADRPVRALSGGQQARVSLATALLGRPEVLVLDEPTVGLDPVLREDLWKTFRSLADEGVTLLVSSHVMEEASRCSWLLLVREGRLLAAASPDEVRARTGTPDMERAFLALIEESEAR